MTTPHQPTRTTRVPFWVFTLLPLILVTLLTIWACDSSDEDESSCDPAEAGCEESSSSSSDEDESSCDPAEAGCEESSSSSSDADCDCEVGYRCEDGECVEGCLDATHCAAGEACSPYEDCISCPDGHFYYNTENWSHHDNFCIKGSGQFCDASFGDDPSETGCLQGELCTTDIPYCVAGLSGAFIEWMLYDDINHDKNYTGRPYCMELVQSGSEVDVTICAPGADLRYSAKNCWSQESTAELESNGFGSYRLKIEYEYFHTQPDELQEDGSLKILGVDTLAGTLNVAEAGLSLDGEVMAQEQPNLVGPVSVEWKRIRRLSSEATSCLDLNP